MHVVGRTRWLKVPYRNTFEIYAAAYALISENASIQQALQADGELVHAEIVSDQMRHGGRPLIQRCRGEADELSFLKNQIDALRTQKVRDTEIAVLARKKSRIAHIKNRLRGYDVAIQSAHSYKGLEAEAVFVPFLQDMFIGNLDEDQEANERRLLYMAMSRARSQLFMSFSGSLPPQISELRRENLVDVVG